MFQKMVKCTGTLTSTNGASENKYENEYGVPVGGFVMEMKTTDGKNVKLYFTKYMQSIMPVKLENGKQYSFTPREHALDLLAFD
jgi:hypothetical protein